jgi:hypothetical protein
MVTNDLTIMQRLLLIWVMPEYLFKYWSVTVLDITDCLK